MRLILVVLAVTIATCFLGSFASAQERAEIQKLEDQFAAAFNRGDTKRIVSLYKDDSVLLPPGSEMLRGKSEIESFVGKAMETLTDAKFTTVDVRPLGNSAAREIGRFNFKTKSQPPQEASGKYVVVWENVGNEWKLATDRARGTGRAAMMA